LRRRLTWLLALTALVALVVAPTGVAGSKKGYKLSRGTTTVTLDPATASALSGITIKPVKGAKGTETTGPFKFHVTNGRVLVDTSTGTPVVKAASIKHVGGLKLTKGDASVTVHNPWVKLDANGARLSVQVTGAKKRLVLATIDLGTEPPTFSGKYNRVITAKGATLKLTKDAADALVALFGLDASAVHEGTVLGTADLTTKIVGKGPKAKGPKTVKSHTH
jgi:hypothetical protein